MDTLFCRNLDHSLALLHNHVCKINRIWVMWVCDTNDLAFSPKGVIWVLTFLYRYGCRDMVTIACEAYVKRSYFVGNI